MRLTLAKLRGEDSEALVRWNDQTLKVAFNRNAISHREWRRLRKMIRTAQTDPENPETDWIIPALTQMLTGWDLYADEVSKKPLPITEETLDGLPPLFLLEILNTIWGTIVPPELPEISSGSTS